MERVNFCIFPSLAFGPQRENRLVALLERQFAYFAFSVANNLNLIGLLLMYSYPTRRFNINNNNDGNISILQSMHVRGFTHCLVECVLCQTCTTVLATALDATSNNAIRFQFLVLSVVSTQVRSEFFNEKNSQS